MGGMCCKRGLEGNSWWCRCLCCMHHGEGSSLRLLRVAIAMSDSRGNRSLHASMWLLVLEVGGV